MTTTWDNLIQQIKDRLDIVEVVSEYVVLKKSGNSYLGICPFHNDSNPSMRVTPHMGIYKCFSCGEGGDALKFLMKIRNMEFKDLILELADRFDLEVPQYSAKAGASSEDVKMPAKEPVAAEIFGVEVMDLEDAVKALWKENIYAESGMGCTGPVVLISDANHDKAVEILKKAGYISG